MKIYLVLYTIAPIPRKPYSSEKHYITSTPSGAPTPPKELPCWHDAWIAARQKSEKAGDFSDKAVGNIEDAAVIMSVVIPAYNEEARLETMLEEAIEYLDAEYGRPGSNVLKEKTNGSATGKTTNGNGNGVQNRGGKAVDSASRATGYEIILVDDGSKDKTVDVALRVSKKHQLHDIMRIVPLRENRGKGGAVTHGFRHVRGEYAIFVDADGASKFSDLGKLVKGCKDVQDIRGRAIAVGSRAHMVGSEAVVKVCQKPSAASQRRSAQLTCRYSALRSAMLSCTPSTYSSVSSHPQLHPVSVTRNVASSCSREHPYHTSCHICTLKDGYSTSKC